MLRSFKSWEPPQHNCVAFILGPPRPSKQFPGRREALFETSVLGFLFMKSKVTRTFVALHHTLMQDRYVSALENQDRELSS